jgi:hypothetical protein
MKNSAILLPRPHNDHGAFRDQDTLRHLTHRSADQKMLDLLMIIQHHLMVLAPDTGLFVAAKGLTGGVDNNCSTPAQLNAFKLGSVSTYGTKACTVFDPKCR